MTLPAGAREARRVGGGDINEAWHVKLGGRDVFVKTRPDAGPGEYALEAFGERLGVEARIGSLRLPNEPAEDWPTFYGQRRLLPLARIASERGALSAAGIAAVERVCERLQDLAGPPEPPAPCSAAPTAMSPRGSPPNTRAEQTTYWPRVGPVEMVAIRKRMSRP